MIELAKAVKKGLLLLWKELATHILVLVNGRVGPNGVNADQTEWLTDKEDAKTFNQMYYLVRLKIVARARATKNNIAAHTMKVTIFFLIALRD